MTKLRKLRNDHVGNNGRDIYIFWCLGCDEPHQIDNSWGFNNSLDKPTFTPSYLLKHHDDRICHSYIAEGRIKYLGDCHHNLKNQTVELPDVKAWPGNWQ